MNVNIGINRYTKVVFFIVLSWMTLAFDCFCNITETEKKIDHALVPQSMMQRRPNRTDSYIQILCIFPKSKQKVPPSSPP